MLHRLEVVDSLSRKSKVFEIHRLQDGWRRECCLYHDAARRSYVVSVSSDAAGLQVLCRSLRGARAQLARFFGLSQPGFERLVAQRGANPAAA